MVTVAFLVLVSFGVVVTPPTAAADVAFNLKADLNGWVGEDGSLNPTLTLGIGAGGTVTITWVNSAHNWAIYAGGTPPEDVSHGSPNALVRTTDVWSSGPTASVKFTISAPGTYEYYCEYHPFFMHGKFLLVQGVPHDVPVASFVVTRNLMAVRADASASLSPGGSIVDYTWTWRDGTSESTGTTPMGLHTYSIPGKYTITLRVIDDAGAPAMAEREVTVNTTTIDWTFYDFFNISFRDWWNYRIGHYNEHPVGAECFSSSGIANGICSPSQPDVPDVASYPYTHWSPLPTARFNYAHPSNNPYIYAPYRVRVAGLQAPGFNLSEPVFLPVLNYGQPIGDRLDFSWSMQFLDTPTTDALGRAGCPISSFALDGYHIRSQIALTMDLQQSRRMFNVQGTDAAAAQRWWASNTDPSCSGQGPAEAALENWFSDMGGRRYVAGKYDIYNSYEWYWDPVYTDMHATVDADGTTHVFIDNVAWGTGVLLARMFYWGNTSYNNYYLDSTKARGWAGMELLGWFEDFSFTGSLMRTGFNFDLSTVVTYHFVQEALPGPDGFLNQVDDVPVWTWRPILQDYLNDYGGHLNSELDRYPGVTDVHSTPGASNYDKSLPQDYVPLRWDLPAGQTWHFQFPRGNVVFYNPNLTRIPANPASNDHIRVTAPVKLASTEPDAYGTWNPRAFTWDVVGPAVTGGPAGGPGPDGIPGTADDEYALESWGAISFIPAPPLQVHALANPSSGTPPLSVQFMSTVDGGVSPYAYAWAFGDGDYSSDPVPIHVYTRPGTFTAVLTVTDSIGNHQAASATVTVTVPSLQVTIMANPRSGVTPLGVDFRSTVTGGLPPYTYQWTFGDGGSSTEPNPHHDYAKVGSHEASLVVTDSQGTQASQAVTISAVAPLEVTINMDTAGGTAPMTVQFTALVSGGSGTYSYDWSFGDGGRSSDQNPGHAFQSAGTYTVTLTVKDQGGQAVTKTVQVATKEASPFSAPMLPIAAVAAGVAIAGVALALRRRRK